MGFFKLTHKTQICSSNYRNEQYYVSRWTLFRIPIYHQSKELNSVIRGWNEEFKMFVTHAIKQISVEKQDCCVNTSKMVDFIHSCHLQEIFLSLSTRRQICRTRLFEIAKHHFIQKVYNIRFGKVLSSNTIFILVVL